MLKSKHNSMFLFECYAVTMLGNIFLHPLLLLCLNMGSSISHLMLILLNKMRLLNVKIDILLRQLVPSFSIVMFIFVFGGIFLQLVTWLIVCPHLYYMTKSLIPSFFLPNLFISFLLVSLAVLYFVHTLTPRQDKLSARATKCIFLGYSRLQKGYHCHSPDTHRYFLSADVTFFEDSPFFSSSKSLPISEVLPLPYISPPSDALSRPL